MRIIAALGGTMLSAVLATIVLYACGAGVHLIMGTLLIIGIAGVAQSILAPASDK